MAKNVANEIRACQIRLRAEKKAGQLLKQIEKAKGAVEPGTKRGTTRSPEGTASTLHDLGISKKQSAKWQRLAEVDDERPACGSKKLRRFPVSAINPS